MDSTTTPALSTTDLARLTSVLALIEAHDTESVITATMPALRADEHAALARHTAFAHAALVIFPETLDGLVEELAGHGVKVGAMTRSVVVRNRLSRRYGVPTARLDLGLLRPPATDRAGQPCELEIFAMATPPELAHIAEDERRHGRENHLALAVTPPDPVVLRGLHATVTAHLEPDGGGYNGHEDASVLYFRDPREPFQRLELICTGQFPHLVAAHQRRSTPGTGLLRLLTGAWATQAIATAVELRLPDHLPADLPGLATGTGTDQESLGRLLRYLTALGVVRPAAAHHELTDLGTLPRSDVEGSMRSLALMYGGPFYRSFAALTEAVRTGEESYAKVFGAHHFTHLAADPVSRTCSTSPWRRATPCSPRSPGSSTSPPHASSSTWPAATVSCCPGSWPPTRTCTAS